MQVKYLERGDYWLYVCRHPCLPRNGRPSSVNIQSWRLDKLLWRLACVAIRDPNFLERLVQDTDAVAGPAVRVANLANLRRQLADVNATCEKLWRQLERLDPDDVLTPDCQNRLRAHTTLAGDLTEALTAAEAVLAKAEDRAATITSFKEYAKTEAATLSTKTPFEQRRILLA
jgi:hypothetical protein